MKVYRIPILALIMLFGTTKATGQSAEGRGLVLPDMLSQDQKETIIEQLASFPNGTQVAIGMMDRDRITTFGIDNIEGKFQSIDNADDIYEIGSISKVMTSTLLAKAVVNGQVTLDTNIEELLGYELRAKQDITLLHLSNHTSGMMRMPANFMFAQMKGPDSPFKYYDAAQLKTWLTEYMTEDLDQTKSNYSNLGAGLLAYGLSLQSGKTYEEMLQSQIFEPLKMTSTTSDVASIKEGMVKGLNPSGQPAANWEFDVLAGAGAVCSNVEDMLRFAKAVISQKDEALNMLNTPTVKLNDKMSVGLGWHIIHSKNGDLVLWHNGATAGYVSSMLIDVNTQRSIVILTNVSAFHPNMGNIDQMNFSLFKDWKSE